MCDRIGEIHDLGAALVIVGSGSVDEARWFSESLPVAVSVYTDPERVAFAAVGARRGLWSALDPRTLLSAVRAWRRGYRQSRTKGDPLQEGGVLVVMPDGAVPYAHLSAYAGDHPAPGDVLAALARAVA